MVSEVTLINNERKGITKTLRSILLCSKKYHALEFCGLKYVIVFKNSICSQFSLLRSINVNFRCSQICEVCCCCFISDNKMFQRIQMCQIVNFRFSAETLRKKLIHFWTALRSLDDRFQRKMSLFFMTSKIYSPVSKLTDRHVFVVVFFCL